VEGAATGGGPGLEAGDVAETAAEPEEGQEAAIGLEARTGFDAAAVMGADLGFPAWFIRANI
jgi:hypothetical protein